MARTDYGGASRAQIQASTQPTGTPRLRKLRGWAEETIDSVLHETERARDRGPSIDASRRRHG